MEKDIVERLRAAEVEYAPAGVWEEERLNALFQEAATEIERLVEQLFQASVRASQARAALELHIKRCQSPTCPLAPDLVSID